MGVMVCVDLLLSVQKKLEDEGLYSKPAAKRGTEIASVSVSNAAAHKKLNLDLHSQLNNWAINMQIIWEHMYDGWLGLKRLFWDFLLEVRVVKLFAHSCAAFENIQRLNGYYGSTSNSCMSLFGMYINSSRAKRQYTGVKLWKLHTFFPEVNSQ